MEIDYSILAYLALGLLGLWIIRGFLGQLAFKRLVQSELDQVVSSDKHKVKGRFE